ncbi:tetratricopeptide repeat protein [Hymenobacter terrenus]|uniref:tetratricopeptide repeat protein n=1 Tax=Hymenobacter terrenus TaxID=1629124 RepID=UPI0006962D5B|nr:tetratricopeptide repeat protein [Hymenobacter terrenus]
MPTKFNLFMNFLRGLLMAVWAIGSAYGQGGPLDSLQNLLKTQLPDTYRIAVLNKIGQRYTSSSPDSALMYIQQAYQLSRKTGHRRSLSSSLRHMGFAYWVQGKHRQALSRFNQMLQLEQRTPNSTGVAVALICIGNVYARQSEYDSAFLYFKKATRVYQRLNKSNEQAGVLNNLGFVSYKRGKYPEALAYYRQALALYKSLKNKSLKNKSNEASELSNIGAVLKEQGEYAAALRHYFQALQLYKQINDSEGVISMLNNIANVYIKEGNYRLSLNYHLQVLKYRQATDSKYEIAQSLHNVASGYLYLKEYKRGLLYSEKALRIQEKIDDKEGIANSLMVLGMLYRATGKTPLALAAQQRSLVIYRTIGSQPGILNMLVELSISYRTLHQYTQASKQLQVARPLAVRLGTVETQMQVEEQLALVDSAQGRPGAALGHFKRYIALKDSLFNSRKSQQLTELLTRYESEKKDQNILLLNQRNQLQQTQLKLQQAQLKRQQLARNTTLGGAVLLLLLLGLLYNRYRLKQRANRYLEAQQAQINQQKLTLEHLLHDKEDLLGQKELLLKEIHHRVKNNLQMVMSLLRAQAAELQDQGALQALQESQARVQAISLIHQFLYQSASLGQLEMDRYVRTLVSYLNKTLGRPGQVGFELALDSLLLDVDQATPMGLILNEVLTNALKYAFGSSGSGIIRVSLRQLGGQVHLEVADNGIGLPAGFVPEQSPSMGLQLIYGLARQLQAQIRFANQEGCQFNLQLPLLAESFAEEPTAELTNL